MAQRTRQQKRPTQPVAEEEHLRKVPKLSGSAQVDLELIIKQFQKIAGTDTADAAYIDVLLAVLPYAAAGGGGGEERHTFQDEVMRLVSNPLHRASENAAEIHKAALALSERMKAGQDARIVEREEAVAATVAEQENSKAKAAKLAEAKAALSKAQREQAAAEDVEKPLVDAHADMLRAQEELKDIVAGVMEPLGDDSVVGDRDALIERLLAFLGKKCEQALLAAIPGALRKAPSGRGRFDKITVESIQAVITDLRQAATENVMNTSGNMKESSAFALGMWAIVQDEIEREEAETIAYAAAEAALQTASQVEQNHESQVAAAAESYGTQLTNEMKAGEDYKHACRVLEAYSRLEAGSTAAMGA